MKYQEFCKEFKKGVLANKEWNIKEESYRFYPDGYIAANKEELDFIRMTNEKYHGIKADVLKGNFVTFMIDKGSGEMVQSRYALQDLYNIYQHDGWAGVWKLIDDHIKMLKPFQSQNLTAVFDSYENAREHLWVRAINFTDNEVQLEHHVYRRFADIALAIYVIINDSSRGFGGAKLPRDTMESWGKNDDEIFEEAFKNTMKLMPPRLYENPRDMFKNNLERGEFMDEEEPVLHMARKATPIVKTSKNVNGAIAMFYPGVKERIAEKFDGSFYVCFMSIHEAILHRVGSMSPYQIKNSLDNVNEAFPEDVLSRQVFLYNAKEKTFEALEL